MKQSMRQIMTLAWAIVRETGMGIGDALRMSWKNFKLKTAMKQSVVKFIYRKVGGETRTASGTLSELVIPSHNNAMGPPASLTRASSATTTPSATHGVHSESLT